MKTQVTARCRNCNERLVQVGGGPGVLLFGSEVYLKPDGRINVRCGRCHRVACDALKFSVAISLDNVVIAV